MAEARTGECAWAAARKNNNSYFEAQFLRLKARCDPKKAVVAIAASIRMVGRKLRERIGYRGPCWLPSIEAILP
jgi:hypothetical protein